MRFTASTQWNTLVQAAAKQIAWTAYARTVTVLDTSNSGTGGWTDVSNRINLPLPDQTTSIEQDFLQFASSVVSLNAQDVIYFRANVFTDADRVNKAKFFEFKLVCTLSLGSLVASDECITFAGWVNKDTILFTENDDSVAFDVMSYDDMASELPAEAVTTQYINANVQGLVGTSLLQLYNINGAFVRDANIASFVLKVGVHEINYEYTNATRQMNLDGGPWVTSAAGSDFTLINPDGTQKIRMYTPTWAELPAPNGTTATSLNLTDDVIVTNGAGATLPTVWYRNSTAYQLLGKCFNAIGITAQTYDSMEFPFWDGRTDVSYLGMPPDDPAITDYPLASCGGPSGIIHVAIGKKLYSHNIASPPYIYQLLCTTVSIGTIIRLIYNPSAGGTVWMVGSNGKTACWNGSLTDNMLTSVYSAYSCAIVANKSSVMIYVDGSGGLKQVDVSGTITAIAVATYTPSKWLDSDGTSKIFFSTTFSGNFINMETWNGSVWVDNGKKANTSFDFLQGVYSVADDAVYHDALYLPSGLLYCVKPISAGGGTEASVTLPVTFYWYADYFYNSNDSKVYFLALTTNTSPAQPMSLYTVNLVAGTPTVTTLDAASMPLQIGIPWAGRSLCFGSSKLFGLNIVGQLWQYYTSYMLSITEASFPGGTIKDILNAVCRACNLAYIVTPQKTVSIYRRYDSVGSPITSGNTIALNSSVASMLNGLQTYVRAIVLFAVDNGIVKHTFNGSVFDAGSLGADRIVTLQNTLIPSQLVKDTAYYGYIYLSFGRIKFQVECGAYPAFQYEPFDGASLTFSGKVVGSFSGVIYSATYQSDGTLLLNVIA